MSAVTIKFPLTAYYIPTLNLANPYSIQRESANKPYNAPLNPYNRVERGLAMFWAVNMLPLTSNTSALSDMLTAKIPVTQNSGSGFATVGAQMKLLVSELIFSSHVKMSHTKK
jgi:hypothetical protein